MVHLINGFLHMHPHSWRDLKMSQMAELYVAMMIKTLGLSLIGIFIPIYLYDLGYSLESIAAFFIINYGFRVGWDFLTAWLVGWLGPKHVIILSHIFLIAMLGMLVAVESYPVPLWLISITGAIAYSFFFIAYHIEFSKLQNNKYGGKQIGIMYGLGKIAGAIGPIVGGVLAYFYGFQIVLVASIVLILLSAVPLLYSPEPVRRRQHVTIKGFPWKSAKRNIISNVGGTFSQMTNLFYWPLFVALFVFDGEVFISVGLITSLGLLTSFFAAKFFGKYIDKGSSGRLFRSGVYVSLLTNLLRALVSSTPVAYFINFVSEPSALAYGMPYVRQIYHEASSYEGYRNMYIALILTAANVGRLLSWLIFLALLISFDAKIALQISFILAGLVLPMLMTNKYKDLHS